MRTLERARESWTVRNWQVIVILSLSVVIAVQNIEWPTVEAVTYERACSSLECEVEREALRILEDKMHIHHEQARLEAIQALNRRMLDMLDESPHVDYDSIRAMLDSDSWND